MKVRKAVLPVAGWGTRFLPATKSMPKEMFPLIDKPIVQFIVEELLSVGIDNIIFVTGRHKRAIEDHFDFNPDLENHLQQAGKENLLEDLKNLSALINPIYVRQKTQKGLGHAVSVAETVVGNEPFVVALGDVVLEKPEENMKKLLGIFEEFKGSVIALTEVPPDQVSKYGVAKVKKLKGDVLIVEDLVEKPKPEEAPSNLAIVGRYLFTPSIFPCISETTPGKGGEIQLTDAIRLLLREEKVYAFKIEGKAYDTGNPLDYLKTLISFALRREDIGRDLREFIKTL